MAYITSGGSKFYKRAQNRQKEKKKNGSLYKPRQYSETKNVVPYNMG